MIAAECVEIGKGGGREGGVFEEISFWEGGLRGIWEMVVDAKVLFRMMSWRGSYLEQRG